MFIKTNDKSIPKSKFNAVIFAVLISALYFINNASAQTNKNASDIPGLGVSTLGNYLAGRHAQIDSKPRFAIEYYKSALKKSPENVNLIQSIATLLISEGEIEAAVPYANRLIKISPEDANLAQIILALVDVKSEKYAAALNRVNKLPIKEGLNAFTLPMLKAWLLAGENKIDEALKILDGKTQNKGLEALFGIHGALISEFAGRNTDAEARFQKTTELRKNANLRVTTLFGNFYERTGQADKAKALYDRYTNQRPASIMFDRAYARLSAGKKPRANNRTARDGVSEALFSLGFAIQNQNPFQTVVFSRLAVYLRPDFTIANLLLAESLDGNGRLEDANKVYIKIAKDPAFSWTARLRIAGNFDELGDTDDAIAELKAMSNENPSRINALIRMGGILQRHKRYRESVEAYELAKKRVSNPSRQHWSLFYSSGISYERLKEWPKAEKDFLKALELFPNEPRVLNYLGYSWVEQGLHLDRALKMIRSAVKQRPRDGYIVDSLGWVLYRLGDFKGAVKEMERSVQLRPEDPTINDHLGDVYWAVGRKNEAVFQWNRALALEPEKEEVPKIERKLKEGLPKDAHKRKGI